MALERAHTSHTHTYEQDDYSGQYAYLYTATGGEIDSFTIEKLGEKTLGERRDAVQAELDALNAATDAVFASYGSGDIDLFAEQPAQEESVAETAVVELPTYAQAKQQFLDAQQEYSALVEQLEELTAQLDDVVEMPEVLTPGFTLYKDPNDRRGSLNYQDVEVGSTLNITKGYDDNATVYSYEFTESSGGLSIRTPSDPDRTGRAGFHVGIIGPDGTTAGIGIWDTMYAKNYGRNTVSTMSESNRQLLAHENPAFANQQVMITSLQQHAAALEERIVTAYTQMQELETRLNATVKGRNPILRVSLALNASIPYAVLR